jgi:ribosomal protein S18 acetylase RimI-like enzyme
LEEIRNRCVAFLNALAARQARRLVPFEWGTAVFDDELPLVWDMNYLSVVRAASVSARELVDVAERLHGEFRHEHRRVEIADEPEGERLRPGFDALGWETERHLLMARLRAPDDEPDTSAVREVDETALQPVRERGLRAEPWGDDDEVVRQILASYFLLDAATEVTRLAAFADGSIASYCDLYSDGRTAQIEAVGTLPEYRNRGLARAVVSKAGEMARASGCDLVFLTADPDDWPKTLYRKLGFDDVGFEYRFKLTPDVVLKRLLAATGASRVTLRQNAPGDAFFPVRWEALGEGVTSIRDGAGIDLRGQPVARLLAETGEQVIQNDCATAFDDPGFHRMREAYGGLAAQIVTPILDDGGLMGILSLHQCGEPRTWTPDEIALARESAERLKRLIHA